jgi:pimeloyl-ACP methyl ester carboxylesterase
MLQHQQITISGLPLHVVQAGDLERPGILFLHGWPESWAAFERIMGSLQSEYRVATLDLPGIGDSTAPAPSSTKRSLAGYVREVIRALDLHDVTLVGHDVGGMITYAYLRAFPDDLARAMIMNVAVPGVDPWADVLRSPSIWHFAFHAVSQLPELLVAGHEAEYFDFFYDAIAARPGAVPAAVRRTYVAAYSRPEALHTGFEWYRAFRQDERDNTGERIAVRTPVLYVRGAAEQGLELERYVEGLRASGLNALRATTIPDSGHYAPVEQPEAVAELVRDFARRE